MRDFLNAILAIIGTSSLTDEEFNSLEIESASYDVETYEALVAILNTRESISSALQRLNYLFLARGVEIDEATNGSSNIYVGDVLES